MIGVDDIKKLHLNEKFRKWDGVRYVLVIVPSNNRGCYGAPVDEAVNDPDNVLVI